MSLREVGAASASGQPQSELEERIWLRVIELEAENAALSAQATDRELHIQRLVQENVRLGDSLDRALRAKDAAASRISRLEQILMANRNAPET